VLWMVAVGDVNIWQKCSTWSSWSSCGMWRCTTRHWSLFTDSTVSRT